MLDSDILSTSTSLPDINEPSNGIRGYDGKPDIVTTVFTTEAIQPSLVSIPLVPSGSGLAPPGPTPTLTLTVWMFSSANWMLRLLNLNLGFGSSSAIVTVNFEEVKSFT